MWSGAGKDFAEEASGRRLTPAVQIGHGLKNRLNTMNARNKKRKRALNGER
jgi:hypothetical protein